MRGSSLFQVFTFADDRLRSELLKGIHMKNLLTRHTEDVTAEKTMLCNAISIHYTGIEDYA